LKDVLEPRPANFESQPPQSEAGYDYVREIGRGGYGYVYLFTRERNGQQDYVAGKFVYRHVFGPAEDRENATAYQRALEGLKNFRSLSAESEYLLRIFDVRQRHEEGYFCYMMELADDIESGQKIDPRVYRPKTLKHQLERWGERRAMPARECVGTGVMLARGLQVLHAAGFAHRDVRPSNIIFVNNVPKLADIDLLAGNDAALTSYIPRNYAAPEDAHSSRADIFSLGKTLYEMCTGLPVHAFPVLPPDLRNWPDHQLILKLNKVIAKACARDLRSRYRAAEEMLCDLERIQAGKDPQPSRFSFWLGGKQA
jgi:serine/threonine protein kinase